MQINPKFADAYHNLGITYYIRGNLYCKKGLYDEAIKDYNKSIEINPKYATEVKVKYIVVSTEEEAQKFSKIMKSSKNVKGERIRWIRNGELAQNVEDIIFSLSENAVSNPIEISQNKYMVCKQITPRNNKITTNKLKKILKKKFDYDAVIDNFPSGGLRIAVKNKSSGVLNNIINTFLELRNEVGLKFVADIAFEVTLYNEFRTFPYIQIAVIGGENKYSDGSIICFWTVYTFSVEKLDQYLSGEISSDEFNDNIQVTRTEHP